MNYRYAQPIIRVDLSSCPINKDMLDDARYTQNIREHENEEKRRTKLIISRIWNAYTYKYIL